MKLHVKRMNNFKALFSLILLALATGSRVRTKKTGSVAKNKEVLIITTKAGSVAIKDTGPVATNSTEPVATNNTGPVVPGNTGQPVVPSNTGLPVVPSNTGLPVMNSNWPVLINTTGPVATGKIAINTTVPVVLGPAVESKPVIGSVSTNKVKTGGPTWGYSVTGKEVYGPDDWGKMSEQCKGSNQSPIDILPYATPCKVPSKPMVVESDNALGLVTGVFTNTGRAAQFKVNEKEGTVFLSGGPADSANYKLSSIQFHVGCMDGSGSEHFFNSRPASAEMQMVFYNKKYKNINEAVSQDDGVTVIAILFDYYGGITLYPNPTLERLISFLPNITEQGSSVRLDYDDRIELTKLVPDLTQPYPLYYTYKGSLTTPPCYESVTWIVLKTRLSISIEQLGQFRQLQGRDGNQLCDNFRPIQPTNKREVTRNCLHN